MKIIARDAWVVALGILLAMNHILAWQTPMFWFWLLVFSAAITARDWALRTTILDAGETAMKNATRGRWVASSFVEGAETVLNAMRKTK